MCYGISKSESGKIAEAINYYKEAIILNPNDIKTYIILANTLAEENHYKEAIIYYEKAIEIDNTSTIAHLAIGNTLTLTNDLENAINHYRIALKLEPDNQEINLLYAEAIEEYTKNAIKHLDEADNQQSSENEIVPSEIPIKTNNQGEEQDT